MATMYISFDSTIESIKVSDYTGYNYNNGKAYTSSPVMLTDLPNNPTESKSIWIKVIATLASGYSWPCVEKIYEGGALKTTDKFTSSCNYTIKPARSIDLSQATSSGGGGTTPTPTYKTNAIYFRTGEGIDKYTMEYSNSTKDGQTVDVTSSNMSVTAFVRDGTNAKLKSFTPSSGYSSTYYFVEYTDSNFGTKKKTFNDNDGYVLSNGTRYIKLFARARKQLSVGTFPSILESVEVTDGTFTLNKNSIYYSSQQKIKSVVLTQNAIARQWTGDIYWGDVEGSTSYLIATVTNGIVKLESSIEPIDYTGNRTIHFTAIGSYAPTFKFRLSDTNEGVVSFQVNRYASQGGALLESKTISSNTSFIEIAAETANYIEITNAITTVIKDGTKEINRNGFTAPLITARADSSSNQDQNAYLEIQIEGSATQSPVYKSYGFRAGLRPNHHTFLVGSFAKSYKYSLDANKGYWTDKSTNPKKGSVKSTERVDFSKYSSLVKRFGCELEGWGLSATGGKVTVPNGKYWITDDTNFYAVWTKNIGLFYWDGNTGATDGSIIAKGLPITNLTAERWNRLREKVLVVATARANATAINKINAISTVQPTDTLTANMFNDIREAIALLEGSTTLPNKVKSNEPVLASYFNGTTSLKSALNAAITAWNNS